MSAERVDCAFAAVDDVQYARRYAGLQGELGQKHGRQRILLGRFENEGVAADDGHGKHPQRDHGGKIEGCDARAHTDRLAQCVGVDAAGNVFGKFAELQAADRTGVLHHLEPAKHITLGIRQGLALFRAQGLRDAAHVFAHQCLEFQHDPRTRCQRRVLPGLVSLLRRGNRGVDFLIRGERNLREHLLGRRVDDVVPFAGLRIDELTVEQHFDGRYVICQRCGSGVHGGSLGSLTYVFRTP